MNDRKKFSRDYLNNRALFTFYLLFLMVLLTASGVTLHVAASRTVTSLTQFSMVIHNVTALFFTAVVLVHIGLNRKSIMKYLFRRTGASMPYPLEMALAGAMAAVPLLFALFHAMQCH